MSNQDTAGVRVPPPLVYLVCILIGAGLKYQWPVAFLPQALRYPLGFTMIVLSFVLFGLVLREFSRSSTSIDHSKPTTEIITSGPFAYSRNPVYLSLTILSVGIATTSNSIWILAMTVPAMVIIHLFVILKEEQYLEKKFGEEYIQYKHSVRRWL